MDEKKIPEIRDEDEEREFWSKHDSADYVDWEKAKRAVFPELRPSLKTISIRLPESMLNELKMLAHKGRALPVPYEGLPGREDSGRVQGSLKRGRGHTHATRPIPKEER